MSDIRIAPLDTVQRRCPRCGFLSVWVPRNDPTAAPSGAAKSTHFDGYPATD